MKPPGIRTKRLTPLEIVQSRESPKEKRNALRLGIRKFARWLLKTF